MAKKEYMMIETAFNERSGGADRLKREKYVREGQDGRPAPDTRDSYFPDIMVDVFAEQGQHTRSEIAQIILEQPEISSPAIPLEDAKHMIINALTLYDPDMGRRAASILEGSRLNLREVPAGTGRVMACRPAGLKIEDVKNSDMYIPDYEERFGPKFTRQDNPLPHAVIDFEYDGTMGSVIYMAHELGHALADDLQREAGMTYRENPVHMQETQAYFVQNIVIDHLKTMNTPGIADAADRVYTKDMARNMYDLNLSIIAGDALLSIRNGQTPDPARLFESRLGPQWESLIRADKSSANSYDQIAKQDIQGIESNMIRLHSRPMGIMTGAVLAQRMQSCAANEKTKVARTILGGHGPSTAESALYAAAIEPEFDLPPLTEKALSRLEHGGSASPDYSAQNTMAMMIDIQMGCIKLMPQDDAKAYLEHLAEIVTDLRERQIPLTWTVVSHNDALHAPPENATEQGQRPLTDLEDMGFWSSETEDTPHKNMFLRFLEDYGPRQDEAILEKTDIPSFNPDGVLQNHLQSYDTDNLIIAAGAVNPYCPLSAAKDGVRHGYNVSICADGLASWEGEGRQSDVIWKNAPHFHAAKITDALQGNIPNHMKLTTYAETAQILNDRTATGISFGQTRPVTRRSAT